MRRILAVLALLAVIVCWTGCSQSSPAPNTTTAPDSSKTNSTTTGGSSMNTNSSANTTTKAPSPTGIKPPMKDEKK